MTHPAGGVAEHLRRLVESESDVELEVLASRPTRFAFPLLVIVHPGDITEVGLPPALMERSFKAQNQLAALSQTWDGDVALLHRYSSIEFVERSSRATPALCDEVDSLHGRAVFVGYGDDLKAFAAALQVFLYGRPSIVVTGAYKDTKSGCVDDVARRLASFHPTVSIDPEAYTAP